MNGKGKEQNKERKGKGCQGRGEGKERGQEGRQSALRSHILKGGAGFAALLLIHPGDV